jgi:hypothetical protein
MQISSPVVNKQDSQEPKKNETKSSGSQNQASNGKSMQFFLKL